LRAVLSILLCLGKIASCQLTTQLVESFKRTGLSDKTVNACAIGSFHESRTGRGRNHHDGGGGYPWIRPDGRNGLQAIHFRHIHIQHNQCSCGVPLFLNQRKQFKAIFSFYNFYLSSCFLDGLPDKKTVILIIIYQIEGLYAIHIARCALNRLTVELGVGVTQDTRQANKHLPGLGMW
jgi:hypothetical protein